MKDKVVIEMKREGGTKIYSFYIIANIFQSLVVGLTLNDCVQLVQEYLSKPVDVSTILEHKDTIDFPSVTLCNKNIVSCRKEMTTLLQILYILLFQL